MPRVRKANFGAFTITQDALLADTVIIRALTASMVRLDVSANGTKGRGVHINWQVCIVLGLACLRSRTCELMHVQTTLVILVSEALYSPCGKKLSTATSHAFEIVSIV